MNSCIYTGWVSHSRSESAEHGFRYPLYMLGLDLDELEQLGTLSRLFKLERWALLSWRRRDYLGDAAVPLKQAVKDEISAQGGDGNAVQRVLMLAQGRCLGFYFSPVNFYYGYVNDECRYLLAEVRNTPWLERHCYVLDLRAHLQHGCELRSNKAFHVSPFMDMAMDYHWHISVPGEQLSLAISNFRPGGQQIFNAQLQLQRREFSAENLRAALSQWPAMGVTIVKRIYWQALKLWFKRVPYQSKPETDLN